MPIFGKSTNSFRGQLPNETVLLATRRHWFVLFISMLLVVLLILFPFIIHYLLASQSWNNENIESLFKLLVSIYLLFVWNLAFYNIVLYSLNTLIITDKRIVENKQLGLFKNVVNEIELDKVQDVSVKIYGPIASFLDYGDIEVQSAGATNKFFFTQFPNPQEIKKTILDSI